MTTQRDLPLVWASGGGQTPTGDAKYVSGWVAEIPSFQNFNYVLSNTTTNILAQAEQGYLTWEPTISYKAGSSVLSSNGRRFFALADSIGQDPLLDLTFSYWSSGDYFTSYAGTDVRQNEGLKLDRINRRSSGGLWEGNDITIRNGAPNVFFRTDIGATNWVLSNINGVMCLGDVGTATIPDGRDMYQSHPDVHRIFHEGHAPTQSEVSGTIPDAPTDGPIYGRSNSNWVKVTSTTVSTSPPPPVAGSGQGWYNLDDGTTYVDVDDGDSSQWVPASPPTLPVSKAVDVTYDDVDTGLGATVQEAIDNMAIAKPNLLYNSNMQICQRGYGTIFTGPGVGLDGWLSLGTGIESQQALYDYNGEFGSIMRLQRVGATDGDVRQWVMTRNSADLAPLRTMTVRFLARAIGGVDVANYKIGCVWLNRSDVKSDVFDIASFTVLQGGAFTEHVFTFTVPAFTGGGTPKALGFKIIINNVTDTTSHCDFTDIKLEPGSTFTGYEPTPYAVDERECMKWYSKASGRWVAPPSYNSTINLLREVSIPLPVPMYYTPAVTVVDSSAWSASAVAYKQMIRCYGDSTGTGNGTWIDSYTASCELVI
jgi:hypothetical protein